MGMAVKLSSEDYWYSMDIKRAVTEKRVSLATIPPILG